MKTEKNILIAFILNLAFSVFEFVGGIFTGSVAIISDALHDIGDAASIGISYFLEKKSKKKPDEKYTYGYARYSVLGGAITTFILLGAFVTTLILLLGSIVVVCNAINRIINPTTINYEGMMVFAAVGVCINFAAAFITREGDSLNQKAVNLHMLEDVFGWIVVLVGAVVMKFTDFAIIDPIMSIGVAVFIFISAVRNLKEIFELFLEKAPCSIEIEEIKKHILEIEEVIGVHHIHIWSLDSANNYATMHIVTNGDSHEVKEKVRAELKEHGICHATLELEAEDEHCNEEYCHAGEAVLSGHHHHHHHHH